ncbi:PilZ domain-containing protein [uncultured Kiloniella sp.]|uniref:PilZ domain-containing protein n=1 Tax=uncultured Kiloniella sp. TaxID=1133091 RepID=UPI00261C060F|nr:PilZ domain-containing protein [uncultured Kiloniella sp.]
MPKKHSTTKDGHISDDKRRFQRVSVLWSGEYADDQGAEQKCVIFDISVNGVRAKFDQTLEIGTQFILKIAGGFQLLTEVVWSRGRTVGLRFNDSPDKMASIMAGVLPSKCLEFA